MNITRTLILAVGLTVGALSPLARAASKTYQVTGQVLEVSDTSITVETTKGKEKWTVDRDAATKLKGEAPKAGDKVTIEYKMTATTIETKAADAKTAKKK